MKTLRLYFGVDPGQGDFGSSPFRKVLKIYKQKELIEKAIDEWRARQITHPDGELEKYLKERIGENNDTKNQS